MSTRAGVVQDRAGQGSGTCQGRAPVPGDQAAVWVHKCTFPGGWWRAPRSWSRCRTCGWCVGICRRMQEWCACDAGNACSEVVVAARNTEMSGRSDHFWSVFCFQNRRRL